MRRRHSELQRLSNLDAVADKVFETFELDLPGLTKAQLSTLKGCYQRAAAYAESPSGWLLFQGNYGSGKTHLAAAIANHRLAEGERVLFVTVPDLLDHLRSTFGPSSEVQYDEMFEQVRTVPLLILDDLGAESQTPWAQEKLYQIINHRYLNRMNTVITTNSPLHSLDPRVRSRLVDRNLTQTLNMDLPDYRRGEIFTDSSTLSSLGLYGEMVFETFDLREGTLPPNEARNLREAYEIALRYARNPEGWLVLLGTHGCGKTHLAAAIANYSARHHSGSTILVTAPDLLDYLRAAFNPDSETTFAERFNELRTAGLLVLDRLDLSTASPWAREKVSQIIDHRYLAHLPTVFTSTEKLEAIDPMVRSRLTDTRYCRIFGILAPDYQGGRKRHKRAGDDQ